MWRHTLAEGCAREKVIADFAIKSSNGAYFACDVIQINGGATGAIGSTTVMTPVPEPETYALMLGRSRRHGLRRPPPPQGRCLII